MQELEERLKNYGSLFGGWLPKQEIGSGSFGRVYLLQRADAFGLSMSTALKAIPIVPSGAAADSPEALRGYVRDHYLPEVELMNRLRTALNIVRMEDYALYEIHSDEGKLVGYDLLIRMELLDTLENQLREGKVSFKNSDLARRMGADIAQALMVCHKNHILHRDVNPGNIFCDEAGTYKLGDFGIAKQLEGTLSARTKIGTEMYLAPEVRNSLSGRYNELADIYSLGLVMYQLLNDGVLPFLRRNMSKEERKQAMNRRFNGEPLPYPATTDRSLAYIARKAAAFDPEERYQSAEELLEAIRDVDLEERTAAFQTAAVNQLPEPPQAEPPEDAWIARFWSALGLSVVETMEVRYMRECLSGQVGAVHRPTHHKSSTTHGKPQPTGELTHEQALCLPAWMPKVALLPINRLKLNGWDSIGDWAFRTRGDLVEVTCGESVRIIGEQAFARCRSMERLYLSAVREIGAAAFNGCIKLMACQLPETLIRIGEGAFEDCTMLQEIVIPPRVHILDKKTFAGCTRLGRAVMPERLTTIGAEAFARSGLLSCVVPDSVNQIDARAFAGCRTLTKIHLPKYLSALPEDCFFGCTELTAVEFPECLDSIGDNAFSGCKSLVSLTLPEGTRRIGAGAFVDCDKLMELTVPATVERFGADAFGRGGWLKNALTRFAVLTPKDSCAWKYCKQNGIRVKEP